MNFAEKSRLFKALSNDIRLRILDSLLKGECCVNNLVTDLNIRQPTISQHLALLRAAGIVEMKKRGTNACYCIPDAKLKSFLQYILEK